MQFNSTISRSSLTLVLGTVLTSGLALGQHNHAGDILLEPWDGAIITSTETETAILHDMRVFGGELGELIPNFSDEPGFDTETGAFKPGTSIGFNILDALRKWDGSDFSSVAPETMTVLFATLEATTGTGFVSGFDIPVNQNGEWHKHLGFLLNEPAGEGVYLLALEMYSTDPALENSQQFFIVWNNGADELVHDEAIEYVEEAMLPVLTFEPEMLTPGALNVLPAHGSEAGNRVAFAWSTALGSANVPGCPGLIVQLDRPTLIGITRADADGEAALETFIPAAASGRTVHLQAVDLSACKPSNWVTWTFE